MSSHCPPLQSPTPLPLSPRYDLDNLVLDRVAHSRVEATFELESLLVAGEPQGGDGRLVTAVLTIDDGLLWYTPKGVMTTSELPWVLSPRHSALCSNEYSLHPSRSLPIRFVPAWKLQLAATEHPVVPRCCTACLVLKG